MVTMKILFVTNVDWFFISHRIKYALMLKNKGYEIHVASNFSHDGLKKIINLGLVAHEVEFRRSSISIVELVRNFFTLKKLISKLSPDLVEASTIKPVFLMSIISLFCRIRLINWMTGLGTIFISNSIKYRIIRTVVLLVYRLSWGKRVGIIFENADDRILFKDIGLLQYCQSTVIRGAGVDSDLFSCISKNYGSKKVIFPGRLIRDKGVFEFVEVARLVKQVVPNSQFILVGDLDPENLTSVSAYQVDEWVKEGVVIWLGFQSDMPSVYCDSAVACLPSRREGLPKALAEALLCGCAVVTFDVPGCKEVVKNGSTGYTVACGDTRAMADKISRILTHEDELNSMSVNARKFALDNFADNIIHSQTAIFYERLVF